MINKIPLEPTQKFSNNMYAAATKQLPAVSHGRLTKLGDIAAKFSLRSQRNAHIFGSKERGFRLRRLLVAAYNRYDKNLDNLFANNIYQVARSDFPNLPEHCVKIYSSDSDNYSLFQRQQKSSNGAPAYSEFLLFPERTARECFYFPLKRRDVATLLTYCKNREVRRKVFFAHQNLGRDPHKPYYLDALAARIVRLRRKLAINGGYENFLAQIFAPKFESSPARIVAFLNKSLQKITPELNKCYDELTKQAQLKYDLRKLEPWDIRFIENACSATAKRYDRGLTEKYFELSRVLPKIISYIESLFFLKFAIVTCSEALDFVEYLVSDSQTGECLGLLRLKFHFDDSGYRNSCSTQDVVDYPVAVSKSRPGAADAPCSTIDCYLTRNRGSSYCFLPVSKIECLFHELGHALEFICQPPDIEIDHDFENDLTEFSSIYMEKIALSWSTLSELSEHYQTGECLPRTLFETTANHYNSLALRQEHYRILKSLFDLAVNRSGARPEGVFQEIYTQIDYSKYNFFNPFIDRDLFDDPNYNYYVGNAYTYLLGEQIAAEVISTVAAGQTTGEFSRASMLIRKKFWEQMTRRSFGMAYQEIVGKKLHVV